MPTTLNLHLILNSFKSRNPNDKGVLRNPNYDRWKQMMQYWKHGPNPKVPTTPMLWVYATKALLLVQVYLPASNSK